jgi:transcriptional regulator with XRE-family HTH domain
MSINKLNLNLYHICENIKRARIASGKTQQEMADLVNVKRSTYGKYEVSIIPDIVTLIAIGKALNIDWTSMVKETITGETIKPGTRGNSAIDRIDENTEATRKMVEELLKKITKADKSKP